MDFWKENLMSDNENTVPVEPQIEPPVEQPTPPPVDPPTVEEPKKESGGFLSSSWYFLVIGLLIGGLAGFYLRPMVASESAAAQPETAPLAAAESSAEMNQGEPHQQIMMSVIANARHFYGDPNAPVTVVEFADFNCGYCGKWAAETLPKIEENYVKTGKVRLAYVHYPILGADSMTAAEGTECAAKLKQDVFWDYHVSLYANQGIGFTKDNLATLAEEMGVNRAEFESCMDNFQDRPLIEDDIRLAQVMGVRGTPAFLVNGIPLAGAYPYDDFERVIEGVLAGEF
jgi:protein-disulfide isomerase